MGLLSFIKDAGEKLFGGKDAKAATVDPADAIRDYIAKQDLRVDDLQLDWNASNATVTVGGVAADQSTREKVLLCCGNVSGVEHVDDRLTVAQADTAKAESQYHTVVKGDTLSKIAKSVYGDAMKYPVIFEANKPMLMDPDKIYPGQKLRIPPLSNQ